MFLFFEKTVSPYIPHNAGPLQGTKIWKLPTGLLDVGEDLGEGAEREVKEETGVTTR